MKQSVIERNREVQYVEKAVRYPKEMDFVFRSDDNLGNTIQRDAMLLYPYVAQGELSTGRVAEIIGTDRLSVIKFYEDKGMPWVFYTEDDLKHDLETLSRLGFVSEEMSAPGDGTVAHTMSTENNKGMFNNFGKKTEACGRRPCCHT